MQLALAKEEEEGRSCKKGQGVPSLLTTTVQPLNVSQAWVIGTEGKREKESEVEVDGLEKG